MASSLRYRFKRTKILTSRSIARDLVLGLVSIVTIVAGVFITLNYLVLSQQNKTQFEQKTHEYTSYLQGSLAAPIWNFDDETITQVAESSLKNEIIVGLRVEDYKQNPIFEVTHQNKTSTDYLTKSVDILYREEFVGRVAFTFSSHIYKERNRELLVSSLLTLAVILLSLISVTGLLLKVLVGKPINQMHEAIALISQGNYNLRAELPPQAEIAHIITQFNQMADQIRLREEALTDTNLRFEAILDNATAVFYLKDVQGCYLLVNRRFEELFHVDRKKIVGQMDKDIFPLETADLFYKNDQKVLAADTPIEFEEIAPHNDGPHTYLSIKFPLKDSQGQIYAICGISTDITRRKLAEQEVRDLNQELESRVKRRTKALNQSNQQLKAEMSERQRVETALRNNEALLLSTLESTADGVIVIQHDEITHANQRFWQIWGITKEAIADMELDTLRSHMKVMLKQPEHFLEHISRLYQSSEEVLDVLNLIDGRVLERFSCPLIIDHKSQGRVWCFRDISEKKQTEEAMAHAKEAAEAANLAKSEFLASMSHEIRTPMNGVMGMSGLLFETNLSKEQREYTNTIQTSAESLLTIINDILDFSKIEAGKLELETLDFDLTTAVEEVADMLTLVAYQKGLELGCLISHDVPKFLQGDPGRLRQIIVNLTSNAIKFTERGHVAIFVELEHETETQAMLRFSVIDTGIGIPADRRDRLFKSFSQVDASITRKFGGTGLGLIISKQLAHLLGGRVGVESVEAQGSTFWFTAVFQKQPNRKTQVPTAMQSINGKRILAVDGSVLNLKILSAYLKSWGCYFATALDGEETLTILRRTSKTYEAFDMVIIDSMIPGMGCDALAIAIKADADIKNMKMVKLCPAGLQSDGDSSIKLGFDASLTKPIKRNHLFQRILEVFDEGAEYSKLKTKTRPVAGNRRKEVKDKNVRVLVVEDNATNQKVARHILQKIGCYTDVAGNGVEAIQAYQRIPYNFILMDVQMPVMDGLTATRKIRKMEETFPHGTAANQSRTPIIALTANAMKGDRENCIAAGMDGFLAKPINPESLWQMIDKWVL